MRASAMSTEVVHAGGSERYRSTPVRGASPAHPAQHRFPPQYRPRGISGCQAVSTNHQRASAPSASPPLRTELASLRSFPVRRMAPPPSRLPPRSPSMKRQCQAEHVVQRQGECDRQVRVLCLATSASSSSGSPAPVCPNFESDREAVAGAQAGVVLSPIAYLQALLGDAGRGRR